ncbi:hypothetical protein B9Z19DRAFT_205126 [Tuber borchii]|uniref:P-loop containing nucleoside triphosphate hydrolase protein n=1 Tax=Tuber borchii TaxID=42251 RepID=A0A2T6ZN92_TUBBO|nr:hypothetical protein B9Z19DRAFT_205126 [Tuber borchii]
MHILYRGFPDLVDKLPPEIGERLGPKPTLYVGSNIINALKFGKELEKHLGSHGQNGKFNEYGEAHVILVRDEETCSKLQAELGRSSLVLTILDSKGMEFEDVILYNFLSTSPYSHRLEILEELFKRRHHTDLSPDHLGPAREGENKKGRRQEGRARPESEQNKSAYQGGHADWVKDNIVLCSELKHLYVGVTRARSRLWILESNTSILGPVRRLFNETATLLLPRQYPSPILDILEEQHIGVSELYRRLSTGRKLSASQWREMGYQMIDDQKYSKALRCFEDAEDPHGVALANAYIIEQNGFTNRAQGSFELANLAFIKASELFLKAHSIAKAVQCRKEAGDPRGAVKILVDSGAYEDAARLSADVGLFLEAGEMYSNLDKHEKGLVGYARGKQFKPMFNYLKKFKSEIEPCCWKQYVLFGYLGEFGKSDMAPDDFEKQVLCLFGSPEEQAVVLLRFGLVKKLFELLSTDKKCMGAYETETEQGTQLNMVCEFLQAEHIATNPWPRTRGDGGIHNVLLRPVGRRSPQIDSFVKTWEDINRALNISTQRGTRVDIGEMGQMKIASYLDLLITRSAYPNNQCPPPLDCIERVLKDLRTVSLHEMIPYSAQLYCGIYEMPCRPGEYILMEWSPLRADSKMRLPLRPVNIGSLRRKILRHILQDIVPPFEGLRVIWGTMAEPQLLPSATLAETHFEKLDWLARVCQISAELSTIIKGIRKPKDSLLENWDSGFWKGVLLEQMEFRSSYEQSLEALYSIRSELKTQAGKHRILYPLLIKNDATKPRMESALRMDTWACVSSLLAQYQASLFLGYRDQWRSTILEMRNQMMARGNRSFKYGCEMITLVNQFMSETEAGDFPGRFVCVVQRPALQ